MLFSFLTVNLIIGKNGLLTFLNLNSTRDRLLAETILSEKQNEEIKNQLEIFENEPDVIEELAREYGLTKEGELIYKFEDK